MQGNKTGIANLPLHGGSCPRWLFPRMKKLAGIMSELIIDDYGKDEFLKRISNPFFFQGFGSIIGFDFHSSGLSTTTCGALKEALNKNNLGIKVAGGKGKTSRKAPDEIEKFSADFSFSTKKIEKLIYSSKITAKVDNSLIQYNPSYQLYHHCFFFSENGKWAVVQQAMSDKTGYARRYHWLSDNICSFIEEPHKAICAHKKEETALNLTAKESFECRKISLDLVKDNPVHLKKYFSSNTLSSQKTLFDFSDKPLMQLNMSRVHEIENMNKTNFETLKKAYEFQPETYEELIAIKGVGPKIIRSLALISELIYGKNPSWKDPANCNMNGKSFNFKPVEKYSYAFGGKDKIPYEIDKSHYDETIGLLRNSIDNARLGDKEKLFAIKRLNYFLRC